MADSDYESDVDSFDTQYYSTYNMQKLNERYAFVVGINRYDDPNIDDLRYCVNDAQHMELTLSALGCLLLYYTVD